MVLPVGDEAAQQVGPAQQRAVRRGGAAERHVVAAARAGVAPVEHELLGAQPREPRFLVERRHVVLELLPVGGGMDVDLDHAGIGRDGEAPEARIVGRRVAFEAHRHAERLRRPTRSRATSEMKSSSERRPAAGRRTAGPCAPRRMSAVFTTSRGAPGGALASACRASRRSRPSRASACRARRGARTDPCGIVGLVVLGQHLGQRVRAAGDSPSASRPRPGTPARGAAATASSAHFVGPRPCRARRPSAAARSPRACPCLPASGRARRRRAPSVFVSSASGSTLSGRFGSSRMIRHGSS